MIRILIVDDHEVVRRGLRQLLDEAFPGAQVAEAGSAEAALAQLVVEVPQLLLLDINLPGRSGLDLVEEAHRRWPTLPILVLSAYPEEEFAVRCLKLGACGYVTKSGAADELVTAVRKALAGGRYVSASLAERLAGLLGGSIDAASHDTLSTREMQVLRLVAAGLTLKEIAAKLSLSEKTISTYRARIADKLGVSSNVELTRYALQHRLVD
jgi:two-component system invasion response regulator UvrY